MRDKASATAQALLWSRTIPDYLHFADHNAPLRHNSAEMQIKTRVSSLVKIRQNCESVWWNKFPKIPQQLAIQGLLWRQRTRKMSQFTHTDNRQECTKSSNVILWQVGNCVCQLEHVWIGHSFHSCVTNLQGGQWIFPSGSAVQSSAEQLTLGPSFWTGSCLGFAGSGEMEAWGAWLQTQVMDGSVLHVLPQACLCPDP